MAGEQHHLTAGVTLTCPTCPGCPGKLFATPVDSWGYGCSVRQLASDMKVSEKTIRRDLMAFVEAGIPIEETVGPNGTKYWRLDPAAARADISFTYDEAFALYLSRRYLAPLVGTHIWDAAGRAFQKIRSTLGENAIRYLTGTAHMFDDTKFGIADYSTKADVVDQLMLGIEDKKVVFVTYRSQRSTEPVTYDVHPYRLARHKGALYLQGFKPDDEAIRTWKVDRIEAAEVDAMPFIVPSDLDLDAEMAKGFGIFHTEGEATQVRIRFAADSARFVTEHRWHPTQVEHRQSDGSLLVEFEVSGLEELKAWVLSFGSQAEVLEPKLLRDDVVAELRRTIQKYSDSERTVDPNPGRPK